MDDGAADSVRPPVGEHEQERDEEAEALPPEPRAAPWSVRMLGALADHLPVTLRGARWQLDGRAAVGILVVLAVAIAIAVVWLVRESPERISPAAEIRPAQTTTAPGAASSASDGGPTATSLDQVVVHVAGLVTTPGVVELPIGARVVDALAAAGGVLPGVDLSTLNLARVLVDGEQIAVGVPAAPDSGGAPTGGGASPGPADLLDLNSATEAELDALPGVGPVLAGRIVAWREAHGAFTAVEELLEVSGIGTATLAELAALVRV